MIRNVILFGAVVSVPAAILVAQGRSGAECAIIADLNREAGQLGAEEDYYLDLARCYNDPDADISQCMDDLHEAFEEELETVHAQYDLRMSLCRRIGAGPYAPDLDPADFSANITNPLLPLVPNRTLVYEADTADGLEVIEVTRLPGTQDINGFECAIVHDVVTVDGELVEDTIDWFSQDSAGNVWYMGEIALNYEDGLLDDIDGSWRYGKDDAQPGVILWAAPSVGDVYRLEYLIDEAEDVAEVLSLNETVKVRYGTFTNCMQTYDWTPLEPDSQEHKFYAPGIGVVMEVDLLSGEVLELVDIR